MTQRDEIQIAGDDRRPRPRQAGVLLDGPRVCANQVLIVGSADYAKRLQRGFESACLVVKTAHVDDFYMALGHVSRHRPAVVIGQVQLLRASPSEADSSDTTARQIRAIATGFRQLAPEARLIVTAAAAHKALATLALEEGFDEALMEPWSPQQLAARVDGPEEARERRGRPAGDGASEQADRSPDPQAAQNEVKGFESDPWAKRPGFREADIATQAGVRAGRADPGKPADRADQTGSTRPASSSSTSSAASPAALAGTYHNDPYDVCDAELGDIDLVDQLLSAPGAFDELVVKMVTARSGIAGAGFVSQAGQVPAGHVGAWVSHRGKRLGVLHAPPPAAKAQLAPWASWMGHWLALERQMKTLWHKAHQDELSGAWNRRFFDHHLSRVIHQAAQRRLPVTLLVFDIDNFKIYNDRYGHAAGDEILQETVRLMRSVIREHDVVARIGGDEFAVIFWDPQGPRRPNSSHPEDVRAAAQRFQKAICSHHFPKLLEEAPGTLTISGGLASYPWDGVTATSLMERADAMLLHSKSQGKNAITFGAGAAQARQQEDPFAH